MHKALEQAVAIGYLHINPSHACSVPRFEKKELQPLSNNQIEALLQASQGDEYEPLFKVALFTGMRQGELMGLTWDCVDFEKGLIRIYRQLQKNDGEYRFVGLKNNKSRILSPAPYVMQVLKEVKIRQLESRLIAGAAWDNIDNLVFCYANGLHYAAFTIYKHFKEIATRIGCPNARFHDLRHTYATAALRSGDDIKTIQNALGHHTAAFTLDTYAHVTVQMQKESAARMQRYIESFTQK